MAETEVKEVSIDTLPMPEYKEARSKGQTTVEVKVDDSEKGNNDDKEDSVALENDPKNEDKEEGKSSGGLKKRLDKEVKRRTEEQARNASLARELSIEREERRALAEKLEKQREHDAETVKTESKSERFMDLEDWQAQQTAAGKPAKHQDWLDARDEWREQREERLVQEEKSQELDQKFKEKVSSLEAKVKNFKEITSGADSIHIPPTAAEALKEMDNGENVWFFLVQHPEVCAELMKNQKSARDVVWRISGYLYAEESKNSDTTDENEEDEKDVEVTKGSEDKPKAKFAPIKPVSGGSTRSSKPLDSMDMPDYKKARAAGRIS